MRAFLFGEHAMASVKDAHLIADPGLISVRTAIGTTAGATLVCVVIFVACGSYKAEAVTALFTALGAVYGLSTLGVVWHATEIARGQLRSVEAQLASLRSDRDAQIVLDIMRSYIEDDTLFKIRGKIHRHKHGVARALEAAQPAVPESREVFERALGEATNHELSLSEIDHVVMAAEDASILMRRDYLSAPAQGLFRSFVRETWTLVGECVEWSAGVRGRKLDYAVNFRKLAADWGARALPDPP